jgi:broad specificity phosphatase PhoE
MDVVRTKESRILVVSHGGPIRLLLSHIERQPLERLLDVDVDYGSLHLVAACGAMVVRKLAKPTRTSAQ